MAEYKKGNACSKCGARGATSEYSIAIDKIKRKCVNCFHFWYEKPLDHSQNT